MPVETYPGLKISLWLHVSNLTRGAIAAHQRVIGVVIKSALLAFARFSGKAK